VIVDLDAWYPVGSGVVSVVPVRLFDSRVGGGTFDGVGGGSGVVVGGGVVEVLVGGRGGVPLLSSGVVLNVTVTGSVAGGFLTVFPCGELRPNASSLNFGVGQTTANLVISKPGVGGKTCVYTSSTVHLITDLNAWS
jgi:hypothetical protein